MFANGTPSKIFAFGLFLALWLALAISAGAQIGNASLGGTVTDQSGAAMPGAELTLTNAATGFEAKFTADDRGEYTFRNLTPGTYDLKVAKAGFQNYVQTGIVITIIGPSGCPA